MNRKTKIAISAASLALLAACGGGGGTAPTAVQSFGDTVATPAPVTPTVYTTEDAKAIASLGLLSMDGLTRHLPLDVAFIAGFIQAESKNSVAYGSTSTPFVNSCANGGNITLSVTKASATANVKTTDTYDVTFNACKFGNGAYQMDGRSVAKPSADYTNLPDLNFLVGYRVTNTNFTFTNIGPGFRYQSNGETKVTFDAQSNGANVNFPAITSIAVTPYSYKFFLQPTDIIASVHHSFVPLASIYHKTTATDTFASSLSGSMTMTAGGSSIKLAISTPTMLTGNVNLALNRAVPTAGVIRTKDEIENLQTETSIQGVGAVVKADSDGNSTLDLTLNTTYTALTY